MQEVVEWRILGGSSRDGFAGDGKLAKKFNEFVVAATRWSRHRAMSSSSHHSSDDQEQR